MSQRFLLLLYSLLFTLMFVLTYGFRVDNITHHISLHFSKFEIFFDAVFILFLVFSSSYRFSSCMTDSYCVYLWLSQTIQISRNVTTNELINWKHYKYLLDEVLFLFWRILCRTDIFGIHIIGAFSGTGSSFGD